MSSNNISFYGIGIEEPHPDTNPRNVSFYGLGIEFPNPDNNPRNVSFYGLGIEFPNPDNNPRNVSFYGLGIEANNYFGAKIKIIDGSNGDVIDEALVTATSTDLPSNHIGNVVQNTNSEGIIDLRGFSTLGNNLKIEKEGYQTYNLPLPSYKLSGTINIALFPESNESGFKKFYVTNKGKVLLNPSNDILFELD